MKKRFAIDVLLALCGLALLVLSVCIFNFRLAGGCVALSSDVLTVLSVFGIIFLETVLPVLGIFLLVLGVIAAYSNFKKMR